MAASIRVYIDASMHARACKHSYVYQHPYVNARKQRVIGGKSGCRVSFSLQQYVDKNGCFFLVTITAFRRHRILNRTHWCELVSKEAVVMLAPDRRKEGRASLESEWGG